jgi:hypothetical protein
MRTSAYSFTRIVSVHTNLQLNVKALEHDQCSQAHSVCLSAGLKTSSQSSPGDAIPAYNSLPRADSLAKTGRDNHVRSGLNLERAPCHSRDGTPAYALPASPYQTCTPAGRSCPTKHALGND